MKSLTKEQETINYITSSIHDIIYDLDICNEFELKTLYKGIADILMELDKSDIAIKVFDDLGEVGKEISRYIKVTIGL